MLSSRLYLKPNDIRTNNVNRISIDQNGFVGINATPSNVFQLGVLSSVNAITGQTNSSTAFGIYGFNSNANGTGIIGTGNNITGQYLINGSGGAFSSSNVGVFGYGNTTSQSWGVYGFSQANDGAGVVGVGANSNSFFVSGTGATFTGTPLGMSAIKNGNIANNQGAGMFIAGSNSNTGVYVAYRAGGTNFKIINIVGFGGTASTDVWGLEGKKDARTMFCPEAPEILFMDAGEGQLKNGKCHISIDPILSRNIIVNDQYPLKVFIQLNDECNGVYVTNRTKNGFDVIELNNGQSNAKFTWYIIANRADYIDPDTGELISKHEGVRFPLAPQPIQPLVKELKMKEVEPSKTSIMHRSDN
ncbi:MAG: hypothetical protein KatS3mg034_0343 [Vicingaceae bacterium]|nr:MAG: hypothetical protein KatS3mg034_0343 [Vicingaceae bacterium]